MLLPGEGLATPSQDRTRCAATISCCSVARGCTKPPVATAQQKGPGGIPGRRGAAGSGVRSAPRAVLVDRQTITSSDETLTRRSPRPPHCLDHTTSCATGHSDPPSTSGGRLRDPDGAARLTWSCPRARLRLVGVVAHTFAQHARDPLRGPPVPALNDGPGR